LGRDDLGSLAPGKRADLAIWDMQGIEAAGAWDPVAALVLCGPTRVRHLLSKGGWWFRAGSLLRWT
jgi:cytosine/adenosine deaminase-related metal-dependent hydrolase